MLYAIHFQLKLDGVEEKPVAVDNSKCCCCCVWNATMFDCLQFNQSGTSYIFIDNFCHILWKKVLKIFFKPKCMLFICSKHCFFIFPDEKYMKPYKVLFKDLRHAPTSNYVINPNINVFYFFLVIFPLWGFCFLIKDFSCFERIYFGMNERAFTFNNLCGKNCDIWIR